jgi:hypothetical protein
MSTFQQPHQHQQLQLQLQLQAQLLTLVGKCAGLLTACDEFLAGADHLLQLQQGLGAGITSSNNASASGASRDSHLAHAQQQLLPPYHVLLLKCSQLLECLDRMSSSAAASSSILPSDLAGSMNAGPMATPLQPLPRAMVPLEQLLLAPHQVYPEDPEFIPRALLISALAPDVRAEQESLLLSGTTKGGNPLPMDAAAVAHALDQYQGLLLDHLELVQEGKAELEALWAAEAKATATASGNVASGNTLDQGGRQGARSWATTQRRTEVPANLAATLSFLRAGPPGMS